MCIVMRFIKAFKGVCRKHSETEILVLFSSYRLDFNFPRADLIHLINLLTPELNPSAQRCLTRFFIGDFAF
jgi:hypothetical protein